MKYWVLMVETCSYRVEVEADSVEEAEEKAFHIMENDKDTNQYFYACTDRFAADCNPVQGA